MKLIKKTYLTPLFVSGILISVLGLASVTQANPNKHQHCHSMNHISIKEGPGHHKGFRELRCALENVQLTEVQKEQIHVLMEAAKNELKSKHSAIKALHKNLHQLTQVTPLDEVSIRQAALEVANFKTNRMIEMLNVREQVKSLLTAEQLEKLQSMRQQREPQWYHED